jgi:hypothetical protein
MCDTMPYDEFNCLCGQPTCRGQVSGHDWQRPELQKRYAGFFSPHVQRRIDKMHAEKKLVVSKAQTKKPGRFPLTTNMPVYE